MDKQTEAQLKDEQKFEGWGIPLDWVKGMRADHQKAFAALRATCDRLNLLELDSEADILGFEEAIVNYSTAAHQWALKCAVDCMGFYKKKYPSANIPPFTICKMGTFGRYEMSPYSDSDILFLCASEHIKALGEGFATYLPSVTATLNRTTPGGIFHVTCDAQQIVLTQDDQVNTLGKCEGAVPDVYTLYSYPDDKNTFVQGMYDQRDLFVTPLKQLVVAHGVDAMFNNKPFANFTGKNDRRTQYNIKSITAFFQRGLAVVSAARGDTKPDAKYAHGATSERILKYLASGPSSSSSGNPPAWKLYYQAVGIRYYMHLRDGREVDTVWASDKKDSIVYQRIEALCAAGLKDAVLAIDDMLRKLK